MLGMARSMWVSGTSRDLRHVGMPVESNHLRLIKPDITINRIIMLISSDRPVVFLPCEKRIIVSWRLEWNGHGRECGAVDRRDPVQIVRARWWLIGPPTNPMKEKDPSNYSPSSSSRFWLSISIDFIAQRWYLRNTTHEHYLWKAFGKRFSCKILHGCMEKKNHVYWDYISTKRPRQAVNTNSDE